MILLHLICVAIISLNARAEMVLNPDSNHGQFSTYALMFEPQTNLFIRSGGNAWGSLGGYVSLFEFTEMKWKPQLVLHGSANASYRLVEDWSTFDIETKFETIDARIGLAWDMRFSDSLRGSIIWTHDSGHISDNVAVETPSLIGPDVGDEIFDFRVIKDFGKIWRVGAGFRPDVSSNPRSQFMGGEEFAEWWPHGPSASRNHLAPFIAAGLEEYGLHGINLTGHVQMGYSTGDHFAEGFKQAWRFVVGAYSGQDMRLKYYKYEGTQTHTVYAGFFVDM